MESRLKTFRDKGFTVVRGTTHPDYSYDTFEEEKDFQSKYWDVSEGDVVFDVGASYGSYTLTACSMGAIVYAFEPEKTVFEDLARNIDINDWRGRCQLSNFGLWDKPCTVNMESYAPHWPKFTISGDYEMDTLDATVKRINIGRIDWIKIDVEGAEENVIKGAIGVISKFAPRMLVECHTFLDEGILQRVKSLLSAVHNYKFEEVSRPPCIMLIASVK